MSESEPTSGPAVPREAATVILVREASPFEVLLVQRTSKSRFMASSYVFPGGQLDPGEIPELAAARELLEEVGVLLTPGARPEQAPTLRARLVRGEATFPGLLGEAGLRIDPSALVPYAHWITPSLEPRRFSARFFLAQMPDGQVPSFDREETTDQKWLAPRAAVEAQARGELKLPPPTLRTLAELGEQPSLEALFAHARSRQNEITPIMPKIVERSGELTLLLPWDPEYLEAPGEGVTVPDGHWLRKTPSRIVLSEGRWWSRSG